MSIRLALALACSLAVGCAQQCRNDLFPPFSSQPVRDYSQWTLNAASLPYVPSGLLPYFRLTEQFVDSIVPDLPYEVIMFAIQGAQSQSSDYTQSLANNLSRVYATLIALFALGLLIAVGCPLGGVGLCLMRCCNLCGGNRKWSYTRNLKYKSVRYWACCMILGLVLLIIMAVIMAGVGLAIVANVSMWYGIRGFPQTSANVIGDFQTYLETSKRDINSVVIDEYNSSADCIIQGIDGAGQTLVDGVFSSLDFDTILPATSEAAARVKSAQSLVNQMGAELEELNGHVQDLKSSVQRLDSAIITCNSPCAPLRRNYATTFSDSINNAPDAKAQLQTVNNSLHTFDVNSVANEVHNAVNTTLADVLSTVDSASAGVKRLLQNDISMQLESSFSAFNSGLDQAVAVLNTGLEALQMVNNATAGSDTAVNVASDTILILGVLLCVLISIIVGLSCLGLSLGCVGLVRGGIYPPARSKMANWGGKSLFVSSATLCICWLPLMVVVAFWFLIGVTVYVPCGEIQHPDYTAIAKTIDDASFASVILGEGSSGNDATRVFDAISLRDTLVSCSQNDSLYEASHLDVILSALGYNLTAVYANVEELIGTERTSVSNSIKNATIMPDSIIDPGTLAMLMDLQTISIGEVDLQALSAAYLAGVDSVNLTELEATANGIKMDCGNDEACKMKVNPIFSEIFAIRQKSLAIRSSLSDLSALFNDTVAVQMELHMTVTNLLSITSNLNATLSNTDATKEAAVGHVEGLFAIGTDYLGYLQRTLRQDVGRCYPPWAAFQTANTAVCDGLVASFNASWFSFGWCLLFLIPLFVVAVWLSWFFYTFEDEIVCDDNGRRVVIATNKITGDSRGQYYHEMDEFGHRSTHHKRRRSKPIDGDSSQLDAASPDGRVTGGRAASNASVRYDRQNQVTVYSNKFSVSKNEKPGKTGPPPDYHTVTLSPWNVSDTWTETTGLTQNEVESLH